MMHVLTRNVCLLTLVLLLGGCAGSEHRQTCFECTDQPGSWKKFSFNSLEGTWRGTEESALNRNLAADIVRKEKKIEVSFLEGKKFLRAFKLEACEQFPAEAVVLLNELWWGRGSQSKNERAFEVFGRLPGNKISYGRAFVTRADSGNDCTYQQVSGPVAMNRLALPAVAYSRRLTPDGRVLASGRTKEVDINFEFLAFKNARVPERYAFNGKQGKDNPPLFFRFVKTTRSVASPFDKGEWQQTEERIFRLWPVKD